MSLVYDRAAEIVEGYGGRIDKLMGDAVLAVFGDPVAHEDDAERTVRAAMDLHGAIRELSPRFEEATSRHLEMHSLTPARIATGEVEASLGRALRNPGFVRRHAVGASKRARQRCAAIEEFCVEYQFRGMLPLVEFELGKLADATKDPEGARHHYQRAIELLEQAPEAQIARDAAARLAALR